MQFKQNPVMSVLSIMLAWYCLVFSGNLSIDLSGFGVDIPITMQSLAILLIGGLLGPYLSVIAVMLYIVSGVAGITTFANNAYGWSVLYGKTGGFLIAFIPAVFFVSEKFEFWEFDLNLPVSCRLDNNSFIYIDYFLI